MSDRQAITVSIGLLLGALVAVAAGRSCVKCQGVAHLDPLEITPSLGHRSRRKAYKSLRNNPLFSVLCKVRRSTQIPALNFSFQWSPA